MIRILITVGAVWVASRPALFAVLYVHAATLGRLNFWRPSLSTFEESWGGRPMTAEAADQPLVEQVAHQAPPGESSSTSASSNGLRRLGSGRDAWRRRGRPSVDLPESAAAEVFPVFEDLRTEVLGFG